MKMIESILIGRLVGLMMEEYGEVKITTKGGMQYRVSSGKGNWAILTPGEGDCVVTDHSLPLRHIIELVHTIDSPLAYLAGDS